MKGIVIKSTGSWYELLCEDGQKYKARLRGKFKIQGLKVTNPIAVGDHVIFEIEISGDGVGSITQILPRENYIIRKSVHKAHQGHLIASNIDQTLLIVTMLQPRTSLGFIDRFLISAEAFRIPAILIFNKMDLYNTQTMEDMEHIIYLYNNIGYKCIKTSVVTDLGMEELMENLKHKKTLFSGHSGVGKSSLLNKLDAQLSLRTAEISSFADKGVHTTTFAEMFPIFHNTYAIDTPGIKELGIFEIGNDELSHYFPEMRALLGQCKYHNCRHVNEPHCAVLDKVQSGGIAVSRYESYLSMLENSDTHR